MVVPSILVVAIAFSLLCGTFMLFANYVNVAARNVTTMEELEADRLLYLNRAKAKVLRPVCGGAD